MGLITARHASYIRDDDLDVIPELLKD